jgi:hypothetical protein
VGHTLYGDDQNSTVLCFPNASAGLQLTYGNPNNSVHIHDLSLTTAQNGGSSANCIKIIHTGTYSTGYTSNIDNVTCRGDDGSFQTHYWGTGLWLHGPSSYGMRNVWVNGPSTPAGTGLIIEGNPGTSLYATLMNINSSAFNNLTVGFVYGDFVQGITIDQGNFNNSTQCIVSNGGDTGVLDQLTVSNSQFSCIGNAFAMSSPVDALFITNNFIGCDSLNSGQTCISLPTAFLTIIQGNIIGGGTTSFGVVTASGYGTVIGNIFNVLSDGINFQAGANNWSVLQNVYRTVPNHILNSGNCTSCSLGGATN